MLHLHGRLQHLIALSTTLVLGVLMRPGVVQAHDAAAEMADSAQRFLKSLDPKQKAQASIALADPKRMFWHYFPDSMLQPQGGRRGLPIKDMSPQQKLLAYGLLSTALSHRGYLQSISIMTLEAILRDVEGGNPGRDPELYHVAIHGVPSTTTTWGWSFEGHHLSVNLTLVDGQRFSVTPSFFGSNPAVVRTGPLEGLEILASEQRLARDLVRSLTPEQRKLAVISQKAPRDIITGAARQVAANRFQPPQGIPFDRLDPKQQQLLLTLVRQFAEKYRTEILDQIRQRTPIDDGHEMCFAWAGGIEPGEGYYFRIQTPQFLFEFDNTQNNANHIHAVWRQFDGDFGEDLLRRHYETSPHHAR